MNNSTFDRWLCNMQYGKDVRLIFTSTTGRSGTGYLVNLINSNALNATAEHDPRPTGYGKPIKWYDNQQEEQLRILAQKKLKRIYLGRKLGTTFYNSLPWKQVRTYSLNNPKTTLSYGIKISLESFVPFVPILDVYIESSHSFIKSFADVMYEFVPNLSVIHLTRNPLEVAKSFLNRNSIPSSHNPFLLDPGYKRNKLKIDMKMSDFQKCLWYWFETELRHRDFIENHEVKSVFNMDIKDLNNKDKIKEMFQYFGIKHKEISINLERNKNPIKTTLSSENIKEARDLLLCIPDPIIDKIQNNYKIQDLLSE
jgi:hypothetical protein